MAGASKIRVVSDPRICVAPHHIYELGRHLRVPVVIDETGWLRSEVEIRFIRHAGGMIQPINARVGTGAVLQDVLDIGDLFALCMRYGSALSELELLYERLGALDQSHSVRVLEPMLASVLEVVASARRAVVRRQALYMGHGTVRVATLKREIEYFEAHLADLRSSVSVVEAAHQQYNQEEPGSGAQPCVTTAGGGDLQVSPRLLHDDPKSPRSD